MPTYDVTMIRVPKLVAVRLQGAPAVLKLTGKKSRILAVDALLTDAMDRLGIPKDYVPVKVEPLSARALARALTRPYAYVVAMRAAGYGFRYGSRTTLDHAREWLKAHPNFLSLLDNPAGEASAKAG